jgi:hypothetical protein
LVSGNPIIDEFDAHGIAGHDQPFLLNVPNSESEHTVEMIEDIRAPLAIAVYNNLGVAVGSKTISQLLKLQSQFFEIINLAVENHPDGFFSVGHWLMASGQVDNGEATKP